MESSTNIKSYKLPVTDTQKSRRNFEGLSKDEWYSLGELQSGDYAGTTDTDSQTDDSSKEKGYTPINKKHGKVNTYGAKVLGIGPMEATSV